MALSKTRVRAAAACCVLAANVWLPSSSQAGPHASPSPKPTPVSKEIPMMNLNDLIIRRPSQFHRVEDKRERIIFECDPKDGWCQFAIGQSDIGQKADLAKADVRKVVQTLMPYVQKGKGLKWHPQSWLAHKGYRLEFGGGSANVRLFSCQTFIVRGGLLMWAGMNCPEGQRARWQPVYEDWIKTAHLKKE